MNLIKEATVCHTEGVCNCTNCSCKKIRFHYNSGLYGIEDPKTKKVYVFGSNTHRAARFFHGSVEKFEEILGLLNSSGFKAVDEFSVWIPFCNLLNEKNIQEQAENIPSKDEFDKFLKDITLKDAQ